MTKIEIPKHTSLRNPSEVIDEWVNHTFLWYLKNGDPVLKIGHAKLKAKLRERYTKIAKADDIKTRERWNKMITTPGLVKAKEPETIVDNTPRQAVVGKTEAPKERKITELVTKEEIQQRLSEKGLAK